MGITLITNSAPLSEIGTKTLSAFLKKNGVESKIIYLNNIFSKQLSDETKEKIFNVVKKDELIGCSLMSKDFFLFKDLTIFFKNKTKIPVIWGGIHPTVCPEESIQYCDYVCIGEGEVPLLNIYKHIVEKKTNKFENIVYKKSGKIIYPKSFYLTKDLHKLPFPDYKFADDFLLNNNKLIKINNLKSKEKRILMGEILLFYSQRGCPFSCTYCTNNFLKKLSLKSFSSFYRKTTPERMVEELGCYIKKMPFIKTVVINDDDFLARKEEEIKIFSKLYKEKINLPFWINAIPKFASETKMAHLVEAGLSRISMGIQTGSERILKNVYERHLYPAEILKTATVINKFSDKIKITYDLIVDNPYENDNDKIKTISLLNALPKPFDLQIHSLVFFPGTELYNRATGDKKIKKEKINFYQKKYQVDIDYSYFNFVILLNSVTNIPNIINKIFCSELLAKSNVFYPLRYILSRAIKVLLIVKATKSLLFNPSLIKHYLKYIKKPD